MLNAPIASARRGAALVLTAAMVLSSLALLAPGAGATPGVTDIVFIGDSITEGPGPGPGGGLDHRALPTWRQQVWEDLEDWASPGSINFVGSLTGTCKQIMPGDWDQDHEGHSNFSADQILTGGGASSCPGSDAGNLQTWLDGYGLLPDVAVVHLGSNDVFRGEDNATTVAEIRDVVTTLQDQGVSNVVVALIIPMTSGGNVDDTNDLNGKLVTEFTNPPDGAGERNDGVSLVDLETGFDPAWLYDGIHPDYDGQTFMAARIFDAVRGFTQQKPRPVANAGSDITTSVVGQPVSLAGSFTHSGNSSGTGFSWEQLSGPEVTLEGDDAATPSFTPGSPGVRVFELTTFQGRPLRFTTDTVAVTTTGRARSTDGLVVRYDFDEGSGNVISDTSGVGTPLDLTIGSTKRVTWLPSGALRIDAVAEIASPGPADKIVDAVTASGQLTLEAWVDPATADQNGSGGLKEQTARIATVSASTSTRNFALGQLDDNYDVRVRTTTNDSGFSPSTLSPDDQALRGLDHVLYTLDAGAGTARLWVNGELVKTESVDGSLSAWFRGAPLRLASDKDARSAWLGTLHLLAAYDRVLTDAQIENNYLAGPEGPDEGDTAPPPGPGPGPGGPGGPGPDPGADGVGYVMLGSEGALYEFGDTADLDDLAASSLDLQLTADGQGAWVLGADGRVRTQGNAGFHGDLSDAGAPTLDPGEAPAALSATPDGGGYWIFTNRGRAIAFGAATDHGDLFRVTTPDGTPIADILNGPVIASVATPTGDGYYMIATDGGVFSFGDAEFHGSTGSLVLNRPVVGIAPDPDDTGYWLVAADGGIFAYEAEFQGSVPGVLAEGVTLNAPVIGGIAFGDGYLMVASDGGIFNFSPQEFLGSLGNNPPPSPIVAVAAFVA